MLPCGPVQNCSRVWLRYFSFLACRAVWAVTGSALAWHLVPHSFQTSRLGFCWSLAYCLGSTQQVFIYFFTSFFVVRSKTRNRLISCVFWIFSQNAGSQLCFTFPFFSTSLTWFVSSSFFCGLSFSLSLPPPFSFFLSFFFLKSRCGFFFFFFLS